MRITLCWERGLRGNGMLEGIEAEVVGCRNWGGKEGHVTCLEDPGVPRANVAWPTPYVLRAVASCVAGASSLEQAGNTEEQCSSAKKTSSMRLSTSYWAGSH